MRMGSRQLWLCVGFFAVSLLTYGRSLSHDFVSWDDTALIVENQDVKQINTRTVSHVFSSYDPELYIPLTFVSYQIDHAIGGGHPAVFHGTNIIIHTFNALLVVWVLSLLLGSGWLPIALGLLFLAHPLNTEAVVWASARKDTLSTFFLLSSLIAYISWRRDSRIMKLYVLSLLLFVLGLLSKVMAISLPIVLILMDLLEERKIDRRLVLEKLPYIALSVIFGIVAIFGKTTVLASSTLWQKILVSAKSTMFYAEKFVLPHGLSFAYPYTKVITLSSPDFFVPVLFCLALLAAFIFCWKQRRLLSFAMAFYVVTLAPTYINFSKGGDIYFASDRYAYVPMIGLLLLLGAVVQEWTEAAKSSESSERRRSAVAILMVIAVAAASAGSMVQAAVWKDSKTLYTHAIQYYPNSVTAHHNLGMELLREGNPNGALDEFDIAFSIKDDPRTRLSRGAALVALKRFDDAETEYLRVIQTSPDEPDAYYGIGNIKYRRGDLQAAIVHYQKALAVKPGYANALNNLGGIYIELERWDDAIAILQQSIDLRPDFVESYYNIAGAYERKGLLAEAENNYRRATELNPVDADALSSLASILYTKGDIDAAAQLLQRAFDADQNNVIGISLLKRMRADGVAK